MSITPPEIQGNNEQAQPQTPQTHTTQHAPTQSHEIDYRICGSNMQYVTVTLDPNETVIGESGAMMYMGSGIQMETKMSDGSTGGSGMLGSLVGAAKRKLSGENAFISHFTNKAGGRLDIAFAAPFPGQIIPLDLGALGTPIMCQKEGFLCAAKGTSVGIGFTKRLGSGWMGGEGFILQKIAGDGMAFVHAGGTVEEKKLAQGETLYVDTGSLVAFQSIVDFDIQVVRGIRNMMFGGEDMFLSKMTGPGTIWVQSMPYPRLVGTIASTIARGMAEQK